MDEKAPGFEKSFLLIAALILIVALAGISYYSSTQNATSTLTSSVVATGTNVTQTSGNMTQSMTNLVTSSNMSSITIVQNATTEDYTLNLTIGAPVQVLSSNETTTATSGEVLASGQVANVTGANMTSVYGLEVHVYNSTSHVGVGSGNVTIQITNTDTNQTQNVPTLILYNMALGPSDSHFGNNVLLLPGSYTIVVTLAGESASFSFTITTWLPEGTTSNEDD
jgi:alpha-N-acetylglucosamine transferase